MNVSLVFALLCAFVLACEASRLRRHRWHWPEAYNRNCCTRRYYPHKPPRVPGFTSDGKPCPIETGCIQLPNIEDAMSRQDFEMMATGKPQFIMYRFNAPFGSFFRHEYVFKVENDHLIVQIQGRINATYCAYLDMDLGSFGSDCNGQAIVESDGLDAFNFDEVQAPVFFLMSDHPELYTIQFACFQRDSIRNGFCEGLYFVHVILAQDPPNNPPFMYIEEELCSKLGLSMDDPINNLVYSGERCPLPPP